eukprot:COSAG05_NODE_5966_length_1049_cov_1.201053_1_plen_197_part_10
MPEEEQVISEAPLTLPAAFPADGGAQLMVGVPLDVLQKILLSGHLCAADVGRCVCTCTALRNVLCTYTPIWEALNHQEGFLKTRCEPGSTHRPAGSQPDHPDDESGAGVGAPPTMAGSGELYRRLCTSMNLHHAYLGLLPSPPPTSQQVAAFVARVAGSHSWYKHLPLERGGRFVFALDATAGLRRTKDQGYIPYTE